MDIYSSYNLGNYCCGYSISINVFRGYIMNKEQSMKETAKKLRDGIIKDDYDIRQILTLLLSYIIEQLDENVEDKDDKRLYS